MIAKNLPRFLKNLSIITVWKRKSCCRPVTFLQILTCFWSLLSSTRLGCPTDWESEKTLTKTSVEQYQVVLKDLSFLRQCSHFWPFLKIISQFLLNFHLESTTIQRYLKWSTDSPVLLWIIVSCGWGLPFPTGSPSRGGDVAICFWHKPTELAQFFLFCSCVSFCLFGPFSCISFHKFS